MSVLTESSDSPGPAGLVEEAFHGSIDPGELRRRGLDPDRILDFSTNVRPFGPSPKVQQAVYEAILDRYPDRECTELRRAISARDGIPTEQIIMGNGSSELLQLFAHTFIRPNDRVLVLGPTYAEYARASRLAGARVKECSAAADAEFSVPVDTVERELREWAPRFAFLCNPNNPTGGRIEAERILDWANRFPRTHWMIDESYLEFAAADVSLAAAVGENLTVLRSLTKAYALAGLRLGYAVAGRDVIGVLCRRRIPWSVSAPAQAAGVAAIEDRAHLEACLSRLDIAKRELVEGLRTRGWKPLESEVNFFLLPVADSAALRERLLSEHILVRDCRSFGIANHIRIGVRTREENSQLLDALSRRG